MSLDDMHQNQNLKSVILLWLCLFFQAFLDLNPGGIKQTLSTVWNSETSN
jgi:hypothetical protein